MYSFASRTISFLLAMALSGLVLFIPHALTNQDNTVNHWLLMILLVGIMIGFIHGIGFRAKSLLGVIISPVTCWPIMLGGLFIILHKAGVLV